MQATANLEDRVRAWEAEFLSDLATPSYPAQRRVEEPDSPLRTPFQRDRDRIVHSKAFRRLKHKTQVFIAPEGDHYRTRLTHTLEACGIARTVARALGLNEDLTEAIGLGHDLGHPPFGHIGEEALDAALRERGGDGFQPQRALAAGRRRARARRRRPQPDRAGPRRDPQPHRVGQAGDARGPDRQARRPRRLHQPRHRRRPARRRPAPGGPAERRRSSCSGRPARPGSTPWSATSSSSSTRSRRHRPERGGRRRDAAPAQVHVRPRLPRRRGAARAGAGPAHPARPLRPLHGAPRADAGERARASATASGSPTTSPG